MNAASETRCIVLLDLQLVELGKEQQKRADDDRKQTESDDYAAAEPHRNHQNRDDDQYRFDQIDEESGEGPCYPFGLIEDLVASDACRKTFLL